MQPYLDLGGNSGISGYEIASDSITVYFSTGSVYLYNYSSPGRSETEEMKRLAIAGQGLNSYISRFIRKNYAQKLR